MKLKLKNDIIMAKKRFDEYFAKVVLEYCFPKRFDDLQISDKPDLRCGNAIGIEVTNCMPKEAAEAFNLWHRVAKQGEQTPQRILERLEQLQDTVHLEGGSLIWEQGSYANSDIDNSPIKEFIKAVAHKIEKLNDKNANYAILNSYDLFVNSALDISDSTGVWKTLSQLLSRIAQINTKARKFDFIYLTTINQSIVVFDMNQGFAYIKHLYNRLEQMAKIAMDLCRGVTK